VIPLGTTIVSPQTGETLIFRSTKESSNGELFQAEVVMQPGKYVTRSHIHPMQEERFVVLEGRFGWRIGKRSGIAGPGETLVAAINEPHQVWNAGDTPMRFYYEHRPALESAEVFFETQFGLSQDGKLKAKDSDFPLLQGAVLLEVVCDFIRPSNPPVWVQILAFPVLGRIGKLIGLRARYAKYKLG
jgi:quercetin dioxygenase-like cupin family protein